MKLLTVLLLCTVAVGCGYGSQATMPASAGTMPVINALNPSMANHGDPAFSLMVNGSSFTSGAYVTFNGAKMSTSSIVTAGNVQVTVTNPAVGGGVYGGGTRAETSSPMTFTIN
jgi:hypothetical protein